MHLLIRADEDGNSITELTTATLIDLLNDPQSWGISYFASLEDIPASGFGSPSAANWDTNYWPEGMALLLEVKIVIPVKPKGYVLPDKD